MFNVKKKSAFFKKIFLLAQDATQNRAKANEIAENAKTKILQHAGSFKKVAQDVQVVIRMVTAWGRGDYQGLPMQTIVMALAALIYFLNPFDLVHDYIPGAGFLDDMAVLSFVIRAIEKEIKEFLVWEKHTKK